MGHSWLQKHNPDINWATGEVKMTCCFWRCCSGYWDKICEEHRAWKFKSQHNSDCSAGELLALVPDDDEDGPSDTSSNPKIEDRDWIFIMGLHLVLKGPVLRTGKDQGPNWNWDQSC